MENEQHFENVEEQEQQQKQEDIFAMHKIAKHNRHRNEDAGDIQCVCAGDLANKDKVIVQCTSNRVCDPSGR